MIDLTVVIPVRNRAKIFQGTMESLLKSTVAPTSIIIVDNGSTDESYEVSRRYASVNPSITIIKEPKSGAAAARNKGLELCKTEWIYFFDSDDLFDSRFIDEVSRQAAEETDLIVVKTGLQHSGKIIKRNSIKSTDPCVQIISGTLSTQSMVFRTEFLRKIGGWNERCLIWNDWELGIRALLARPSIKWIKTGTFHSIRIHPDSITGGSLSERRHEISTAFEEALQDTMRLTFGRRRKRLLEAFYYRSGIIAGKTAKEGSSLHVRVPFNPSPLQTLIFKLLQKYSSIGGRGAWKIALTVVRRRKDKPERILLMHEYSSVHYNLAEGLKALGYDVTLASSGDHWKNYPRDIDLKRDNRWLYLLKLILIFPRFRGYDVVQLINPIFLELKAERIKPFYRYLRRHNGLMVLCAMGDDYYCSLFCSTYDVQSHPENILGNISKCSDRTKTIHNEWIGTQKENLNRYIASDCDGIVAGSHDYWHPYLNSSDKSHNGKNIKEKVTFIPLPIICPDKVVSPESKKLRIFIGIQKTRTLNKGTDIMVDAAKALLKEYPDRVEIITAENVPFQEYSKLIDSCDILLDQIFTTSPGMNALLALSKGIIPVLGCHPEHYILVGESEYRPIINVEPSVESVYKQLENLILNPDSVTKLKAESRFYAMRNHDYIKVAGEYVQFYRSYM